MSGDESAARTWLRRLVSLPGLVAATALTAAVSWGATELVKGAKSKIEAHAPVAVSIETNPAKTSVFAADPISLILPRHTRSLGNPGHGCTGFRPWARSQGGVDAGSTRLVVVVQGRVDAAVLISAMGVNVLSRSSPMRGTSIECPTQGAAQYRAIKINLDRPVPRAIYSSSGSPFGFTLAKGETETFTVVATARRRRYKWDLDLDLDVDGKKQTIHIDDHGEPFETTPGRPAQTWEWNHSTEWMRHQGNGEIRVRPGRRLPAS